MKVAVIHFVPMNDIGGINSWITNFVLGCDRLGHEVTLFNVAPQMRYHGARPGERCEAQIKARFSVLPGVFVPLSEPNLEELESYDVVVFGHPSYHPTKVFTECEYIDNWKLFYELDVRKIVVFHDKHWDRSNAWLVDVAHTLRKTDKCVAAQRMFDEPVSRYPADCIKEWHYFPIDIPSRIMPWEKRGEEGCLITQWLALKNHGKMFDAMDEAKSWPMLHMFGNGQTYYNQRWRFRKLGIVDKTRSNNVGIHYFYGFKSYEETMSVLRRMRFALDLSTQGQTNMSHWEPLCYGTPTVIHTAVVDRDDCEIPEEFCVRFDWSCLNEVLWETVHDCPYDLRAAQEWVSERCSPDRVAERILA